MRNIQNFNVQELDDKEMKNIGGGKNILEYLAEGFGYLVGTFTWSSNGTIPEGSALAAQQEFVFNSGGLKY
jgi:hypothetical protein